MGDLTLQDSVQESGLSITRSDTISAAQGGNLATRDGNDSGNVSLSSGHGIGNGDPVDLYWGNGIRYGMTAGNVSSLNMAVTGGDGDVLPSALTLLSVAVPTEKLFAVDGGEVVGLMIQSPVDAVIRFLLGNGTSVYDHQIEDTKVYNWHTDDGNAPLSGNISKLLISHADLEPQVINVGAFVP